MAKITREELEALRKESLEEWIYDIKNEEAQELIQAGKTRQIDYIVKYVESLDD